MSFTAVAALARDNDYRLIIIITGTSVPLFEQSTERLKEDLRLIKRKDRLWQFFANPKNRPEVKQRIASALESDENLAGIGKQTVLVTVMKNKTHLRNLIGLLSNLKSSHMPTLIIDDES